MCTPAPAPPCSNTELNSEQIQNWNNFSCDSSDIQLVRKPQRLLSSASHKPSSDNVCIMCLFHCGALWLWGTTFASLSAALADTTDLLQTLHLHFFCVHRRFFPLLIFSYFLQCLITCAEKAEQEKTDNETQRRKMPNQSKPPPYPHTISASCSPIKLNLVTCSCVPQKLEEINSNANEKTHNLLSAEECMLH